MKKMIKLLKGHKYLVFLDFEGTQFSHELIAIGAVLAVLDKNGNIKKNKPSFKVLVKAQSKVGKVVTQLTGITDSMLEEKGVSFRKAMEMLKKYCGIPFNKSTFTTFGNHDLFILNSSIQHNLDAPKEICSTIQKNYFDYLAFIQEFVKDNKSNNPYSLVNYCKHFGLTEAGKAHEPDVDAINLMHLYQAFFDNKSMVLDDYLETLSCTNHLPAPISKAVKKLASGENVSADEFKKLAEEYLK